MTLQTIPSKPLRLARIVICFTLTAVFGAFAIVHAETTAKDSAQDTRLDDIDHTLTSMQAQRETIRTRRDAQVDGLYQKLSEANERAGRDEGVAAGAFAALGVLQTLGHLKKKQA